MGKILTSGMQFKHIRIYNNINNGFDFKIDLGQQHILLWRKILIDINTGSWLQIIFIVG